MPKTNTAKLKELAADTAWATRRCLSSAQDASSSVMQAAKKLTGRVVAAGPTLA